MAFSYNKSRHHQAAYTLGELFFVIFILFAIISISLSLWRNARNEAHRLTCGSDVIQIQRALESYFKLEKSYPDAWLADSPLISLSTGQILMARMPINQAWWGEKACSDSTVTYAYTPISGGYTLRYCVNGQTEEYTKKRPGIILPKGKSSVTCPAAACTGSDLYYNKTSQSCTNVRPDLSNDPVAAGANCDICSDYGDLCSGGYLFCKPTDPACHGQFIVAAPEDLSELYSWDEAKLACEQYQSAGLSGWSLPQLASSSAEISNELCQLMRVSNQCDQQVVAGKCSGACLLTDQQKLLKLSGLKYWSSLEASDDTAWLQSSDQGRAGYDDKSNTHSVRCIRRL